MLKIFLNDCFDLYFDKFPITLLDVGASGGFKEYWKPLQERSHIIGFEPDQRAYSELLKSNKYANFDVINTALLDREKKSDFFLTKKQQLSSVFLPNIELLSDYREANRFDIIDHVKIKCDCIDNLVKNNKLPAEIDFIKLDTQGSELKILKGAENSLLNTVYGIEVEIEFLELYKDQPLFADVDNYIRSLGFDLYDIRPCLWKRKYSKMNDQSKGQIIFGDALYFKSKNTFNKNLSENYSNTTKISKLLNSLALLMLYEHYDRANEHLNNYKNYFSKYEHALLEKTLKLKPNIRTKLNESIPYFKGRSTIASLLFKLFSIIQPNFWKCYMHLSDGQMKILK